MDNGQIPPVQPMPMVPNGVPVVANNIPMTQRVGMVPGDKKDNKNLIKTIVIIAVSLIAVTFIGLFIWMFMQYSAAKEDVDGQINMAVIEANNELAAKLELEFQEREKDPYRLFSGPADYGELTFEYPKTWSVYIASDATNRGDFEAYFNPIQVEPVSVDSINALRVTITNKGFDSVVSDYQREVERKDSGLTVESVTIGDSEKGSEVTANRYTGKIPNTDLNGYIVIFKIRDKTVILRTDSVLFKEDFDKLLNTIRFNA